MRSNLRSLSLLLIPTAVLVGCGEKRSDTASADSALVIDTANPEAIDTAASAEPGDTAPQPSSQASSGTAGTSEASRPLTVEDIVRWEKGIAGEMQAVQAAAAKGKGAQTDEEKSNVMMEVQEMRTTPAGARAAGLDEERYKFVRSEFSEAVKYLTPIELETGINQAPPEMREKMRQEYQAAAESYFKQTAGVLPPEVVEALRPRALELRKKNLELVGARLKAAGLAR